MSKPFISVITPSLNQGDFIEDAILSVARQEYPNFEHIIVDGGSTDQTSRIAERYRHVRWISEPDEGQSDAINKGFRMAAGDLVAWLNGDDYYLPGTLQAVAEFAEKNPAADIIYGNSMHVDRKGNLLRVKMEHEFDYRVLLYYGCYIDSNAVFIRNRVVQQQLLLDKTYTVSMDYEYFVRLAAKGIIYRHVDRMLAAFRWHDLNNNTLQINTKKRRKERLNIQRTWSGLQLPDRGYDTLAKIFHAKRIVLKLLNGNSWRELKERRRAPYPTRWFLSEAGHSIQRESPISLGRELHFD
jgi:glycosyltransferase involved in cell wall biosynthesis